jgi:hypothetical protein
MKKKTIKKNKVINISQIKTIKNNGEIIFYDNTK